MTVIVNDSKLMSVLLHIVLNTPTEKVQEIKLNTITDKHMHICALGNKHTNPATHSHTCTETQTVHSFFTYTG